MITDKFYAWLVPLEKKIGVTFRNRELLVQAMTQRSYLVGHPKWPVFHNDRLELFGDSVISLVVTENLLQLFPKMDVGPLVQIKAELVKNDTLAEVAHDLDLVRFLKMSKKTEACNSKENLFSDVYEAIVGAIYLDQGIDVAQTFIKWTILPRVKEIIDNNLQVSPKTELQALSQRLFGGIIPSYKIVRKGDDNKPCFLARIFIGDACICEENGTSIKIATVEAAKKALKNKVVERLLLQQKASKIKWW